MPVAVVSIPVADQEKALAFYTEVLGLKVVNDQPMGPTMRWLQLQPADGGFHRSACHLVSGDGARRIAGTYVSCRRR